MGVTSLLGVTEGVTVGVSAGLPVLELVPVGLPEGDTDCEGVLDGEIVPVRVGAGVPLSEEP